MSPASAGAPGRRPEILIAILGLVGVLFTAVLSNWDKLSGHTVTAQYAGYTPSENIDSEIRTFFQKTGSRESYDFVMEATIDNYRTILSQQRGMTDEKLNRIISFVRKKLPSYEDYVEEATPVWRRYFSLDQVQALNKFYSTPQMEQMVKVRPLADKAIAESWAKKTNEMTKELIRAEESGEFNAPASGLAPPPPKGVASPYY